MRITWGTVIAVMDERPGIQRLEVACDDSPDAARARMLASPT